MSENALRSPKPKRPTQTRQAKPPAYPVCAIYTKFPPGDDRVDSTLHVNFDALPLGKMRSMATSMLNLPPDTTDWSNVRGPLRMHLRTILSTAQCVDIQYDPVSFIIELVIPTRALDDVRNIIIKHLSDYGIPAKAFK